MCDQDGTKQEISAKILKPELNKKHILDSSITEGPIKSSHVVQDWAIRKEKSP